MKRILSFLLPLVLILTLTAGCAQEIEEMSTPTPQAILSDTADSEESPAPSEVESDLEDESDLFDPTRPTLVIWYPIADAVAAHTTNLADGSNIAWKGAMDYFSINIKFIHPLTSFVNEYFQLMVVSRDLADIMASCTSYYSGGVDKAIADGVFLALNDLAEELAPNYMKWVNSNEINRKNNITDLGNMVGFSQIYDRLQPQVTGYAVRQDWLDDLGLESPVTIDEWHTVLSEFKSKKTANSAAPLDLQMEGVPSSHFFVGAFGAAASPYFLQKDGTVFFSAISDGYRSYLGLLSKWYSEGLVNPDFYSTFSDGYTPNSTRISNNETGATSMAYKYAGDHLSRTGVAENGAFFSLTDRPVVTRGQELLVTDKTYHTLPGGGTAISATSELAEEAVKFIDFFYSDEGALLANYGVENISFEYNSAGTPIHTDLISNNSQGLSPSLAQQIYLINDGFMLYILDREENTQSGAALEYITKWDGFGKYNIVGALTYAPEEFLERLNLMADIQTYTAEFTLTCIIGSNELNDTTWDTFVQTVSNLGIDRATKITQDAYDRYQAR